MADDRLTEIAARVAVSTDPGACGTCRSRVRDGLPVEHDECAARATLLEAPGQPYYEDLVDLTTEEKAALPARFHTPTFDRLGKPNAWLCRVCWGDGWVTQWPCATAQKHGAEVFTADHIAQGEQRKRAAQLEQARAIAVELENENARLRSRVRGLERPAVEAKRNEIRQSFAELTAQCQEDRDYEGAFNVECRLREREGQWKREDEEASRG